MSNPFKGIKFKEETDRTMVLDNFKLLFNEKSDAFPTLKLSMIYGAFESVLEDFTMTYVELKTHLDALAEAPHSGLIKKKEEYCMRD